MAAAAWDQTAQISYFIVKMNSAKKMSLTIEDFNPTHKKKAAPIKAPITALKALLPR